MFVKFSEFISKTELYVEYICYGDRTFSGLSAPPKYTSIVLRSHLVRKMNKMADFHLVLSLLFGKVKESSLI